MAARTLLGLLVCASLAAPAGASSIDQEALPNGLSFTTDNDTGTYQEFLVGRSGLLTQIDIYVVDPFSGEACCELRIFDAATLIEEVFFDGLQLQAGWNSFLIPTPIAVRAGDRRAFDLDHDNVLELAASDYAAGALDWSCVIDGCVNPFRLNPQFAADALAQGDLIPFCTRSDPADCSFVDPYDPAAPEVSELLGLHMPIDYAFRTHVVPEPAAGVLLAVAALAAHRRRGHVRSSA